MLDCPRGSRYAWVLAGKSSGVPATFPSIGGPELPDPSLRGSAIFYFLFLRQVDRLEAELAPEDPVPLLIGALVLPEDPPAEQVGRLDARALLRRHLPEMLRRLLGSSLGTRQPGQMQVGPGDLVSGVDGRERR